MAKNQEGELIFIKVVQSMMVNGRKIRRMALGYFTMPMDKNMKETG